MRGETERSPRAGDWIEVHGLHGEPARNGQIVAVIGGPGHERYRVRWDEEHESIVYPSDGVVIHRRAPHGAARTP